MHSHLDGLYFRLNFICFSSARMLSSPTPRPSSSDLGFFSSSKSSNSIASSSSNVIVKTRLARKTIHTKSTNFHHSQARPVLPSSSPSPDSSPHSSPPSPKKRKSTSPEYVSPLHREVKRLRPSASSLDKPRKRASKPSHKTPSRAPSRQQTLQPSPEPIYRTSRSRSTSAFHTYDDDGPVMSRRWMTDQDGHLTSLPHLSSEAVVRKLLKTYKHCQFLPSLLSPLTQSQISITLTIQTISHSNPIPIIILVLN